VVARWLSWIQDPIYTLELLKYPDSRLNPTAWCSSEYSKMLGLSEETTNEAERNSYLLQAETIALNELPLIPIIHKTFTYTKAPSISGEKWINNGLIALQWLKKG
jgi:ABC-type oligopeptide transport system substrate-binding subunit